MKSKSKAKIKKKDNKKDKIKHKKKKDKNSLENDSEFTQDCLFEYGKNQISITQGEIFPAIFPNVKKIGRNYDITPLLPHGIKLDGNSGCISGITSLKTTPGTNNYKIICTSNKVSTFANIKITINSTTIKEIYWLKQNNKKVSIAIGYINKQIEPISINYSLSSKPLKYQLINCGPFEAQLFSGINFDSKKGIFTGKTNLCGKISFKIKIYLNNQTYLTSNVFVIEILPNVGKKTQLSLQKIQNVSQKNSIVKFDPQNIYSFFSSNNGLDESNLLKCLQLLQKNVTTNQNKKLYQKYNKSNGITFAQFNTILEQQNLKQLTIKDLDNAFNILLDNPNTNKIDKNIFIDTITSMGDILDQSCLKQIIKITDPNNKSIIDINLLKKEINNNNNK